MQELKETLTELNNKSLITIKNIERKEFIEKYYNYTFIKFWQGNKTVNVALHYVGYKDKILNKVSQCIGTLFLLNIFNNNKNEKINFEIMNFNRTVTYIIIN